ncbi:hypothetical protein [Leptolyngbya sp. FACHB-261]|nr:hypothetical protein [Leptolyngbya sp. FACHB-261]MBD2102965.1 hypothetical protein [Leptolyngbya sp. FACHB-261]
MVAEIGAAYDGWLFSLEFQNVLRWLVNWGAASAVGPVFKDILVVCQMLC